MNLSVAEAVEELQGLQNDVCSQFSNELNHLISVGQNLKNPTTAQIQAYSNAVKAVASIIGSGNTSLQDDLEGIATSLTIGINNANPASYLTPGNPNFLLHPYCPYTTDPLGCQGTTPGYYHRCGCNPPPQSGIYWTGLLILASFVGAAVVISKLRK